MAPISQETNLEVANWAKVAELRALQRGVHVPSPQLFCFSSLPPLEVASSFLSLVSALADLIPSLDCRFLKVLCGPLTLLLSLILPSVAPQPTKSSKGRCQRSVTDTAGVTSTSSTSLANRTSCVSAAQKWLLGLAPRIEWQLI